MGPTANGRVPKGVAAMPARATPLIWATALYSGKQMPGPHLQVVGGQCGDAHRTKGQPLILTTMAGTPKAGMGLGFDIAETQGAGVHMKWGK